MSGVLKVAIASRQGSRPAVRISPSSICLPNGSLHKRFRDKVAEGVGFEPTIDFSMPVFKTGAFNQALPPLLDWFITNQRNSHCSVFDEYYNSVLQSNSFHGDPVSKNTGLAKKTQESVAP